jgi:hypothetical protein
MGTSLEQLRATAPGLLLWLPRVFWVLGGYMLSTGLLTCYVAATSFCSRIHGAAAIVALTGLTSIGLMAGVNFLIDSDFKWLLLSLTAPWLLSLWLYHSEER